MLNPKDSMRVAGCNHHMMPCRKEEQQPAHTVAQWYENLLRLNFADSATQCVWKSMAKAWSVVQST